jgi:hypothetical protein
MTLPEVSLLVARQPDQWSAVKDLITRMFDRIAPKWESEHVGPNYLDPLREILSAFPAQR